MFLFREKLYPYVRLHQEDSIRVNRRRIGVLWEAAGIIVSITLAFVAGWSAHQATYDQDFGSELSWAPELRHLPTILKKFDGNFLSTNIYKGEPSLELDEAWNRFSWNRWIDGTAAIFGVTEEDIQRSMKGDSWLNTTARFEERDGGQYMGTLEMFHQMHCVNLLRMSLRPHTYNDTLNAFTTEKVKVRHLDHCIDMIRQIVMCSGDSSLLTFHWVEGNPFPYPDFSTWHHCRDPETILQWALSKQPDLRRLPEKQEDTVAMPEAP